MSDTYNDNHMSEGERLESLDRMEPEAVRNPPRRRGQAAEELPGIIYRLKTLHSSETSYGYYLHSEEGWPHFRREDELEALLEGPLAPPVSEGAEQLVIEEEAATADQAIGAAPAPTVVEVTEAVEAIEAVEATEAVQPDDQPANQLANQPAEKTTPGLPHSIPARALVVAPTKYGKDIVEVQGITEDRASVNADELVLIERPAGIDDLRKLKENRDKEKQAYELCRDKIWARKMPMKLVSAHFLLDEPKIIFYFTAESRVDFRELVKDLVSLFKTRIELRQIGVRDEARVTGGCGVCGRVLCCHGVSDRLNPVSIKMAKDQNLSLNSLKISGPCGRLLCCLSYEYQFYKDARRELPQEGIKFTYDGTLFKVVEVNALSSMVRMAGEDGRILDMKAERFKYSEGRWKVIEAEPEPVE